MDIKPLEPLQRLQPMQTITDNTKAPKSPFLSEIELILYATNLCYYSMRILRDEIQVKIEI